MCYFIILLVLFSMKLNFIIFITVLILHIIINNLEKLVVQNFFGSIRRPCQECADSVELKCLGMPSGHTESSVIIAAVLYMNKLIPLWGSVLIVIITALQRILCSRHTINQVLVGFGIGCLYTLAYGLFSKEFRPAILLLPIVYIIVYISIITLRMNNVEARNELFMKAFKSMCGC